MEKNFYKILGIPLGATQDKIKKAYKKLALKFHPDKNKDAGAAERFKEVADAYAALTINKKACDAQGEVDGLNGGMGSHNGPDQGESSSYPDWNDPRAKFARFFRVVDPEQALRDLRAIAESTAMFLNTDFDMGTFANMRMGQAGAFQSDNFNLHGPPKRKVRTQDPPVLHDLYLSLEEIAIGCVKKMMISRKIIQPDNTSIQKEKLLTIYVKPGWKAGTRIIFHKEGDQRRNKIPADIIFIIRDKEHRFFKREGSNIRYTATISLKQVCVFFFVYVYLLIFVLHKMCIYNTYNTS